MRPLRWDHGVHLFDDGTGCKHLLTKKVGLKEDEFVVNEQVHFSIPEEVLAAEKIIQEGSGTAVNEFLIEKKNSQIRRLTKEQIMKIDVPHFRRQEFEVRVSSFSHTGTNSPPVLMDEEVVDVVLGGVEIEEERARWSPGEIVVCKNNNGRCPELGKRVFNGHVYEPHDPRLRVGEDGYEFMSSSSPILRVGENGEPCCCTQLIVNKRTKDCEQLIVNQRCPGPPVPKISQPVCAFERKTCTVLRTWTHTFWLRLDPDLARDLSRIQIELLPKQGAQNHPDFDMFHNTTITLEALKYQIPSP